MPLYNPSSVDRQAQSAGLALFFHSPGLAAPARGLRAHLGHPARRRPGARCCKGRSFRRQPGPCAKQQMQANTFFHNTPVPPEPLKTFTFAMISEKSFTPIQPHTKFLS